MRINLTSLGSLLVALLALGGCGPDLEPDPGTAEARPSPPRATTRPLAFSAAPTPTPPLNPAAARPETGPVERAPSRRAETAVVEVTR